MANNQAVYYEAGRDYQPFEEMTTADFKVFTASTTYWSRFADDDNDFSPKIYPNGLVTGGKVIPGISGTNDKVDAAASTCYLDGVLTSVNASADLTITRAANGTHRISSITITSGGAYAVVTGADAIGASSFSETRGVDGGPPWIPTGSIEVAQVRTSTTGAAKIKTTEIYAVPNVHKELSNYPVFRTYPLGKTADDSAYIEFDFALPDIHSDDAGSTTYTKEIFAETYEPLFAQIPYANEFVPPVDSFSVNSTQYYGVSRGSVSSTINQGTFTVGHDDNVTDPLVELHGRLLTFKFFPDKLKTPYNICQGTLGVTPANPAGGEFTAACTVSAETVGVNKRG